MNDRRRLVFMFPALLIAACRAENPNLNVILIYQPTMPAIIKMIALDDAIVIGERESHLYVSPIAIKQDALFVPVLNGRLPEVIRVRWHYQGVPRSGDVVVHESDGVWILAERSVPIRSAVGVREVHELEREPHRYRLRLRLRFDHDELRVTAEAERSH